MTDTPDELMEPTEAQLAIHGKLVGRFKGFSFKTTPPVEVDGVARCGLMVQRRPKDEWYKLKTFYPVKTTKVEDEQLLRLIERELMMWGDGTARDRERDGVPQYPRIRHNYPR
jgi:hypothetical protein